jgi:hypothetical protein
MAADGTPGTKNQPQFLGSGAPATAVDLNLISDYAAKVGNRRTGTITERGAAAAADVWEGLAWQDTDGVKAEWIYQGGSFVFVSDSAWQTYTPTLAGLTPGNGVLTARSFRRGKLCVVDLSFTLGTTSAVTGSLVVPLPYTGIAPTAGTAVVGIALFRDASPSANAAGVARQTAATTVDLLPQTVSGSNVVLTPASSTVPFTWTTSDYFTTRFEYELA